MDILRELGPVSLGSRLKRLGERFQAGAAQIVAEVGLPVQPAQIPLLAALDGQALTIGQLVQAVGVSQPGITRAIGQLVKLGMVRSETGADLRQRSISLTPAGAAVIAKARHLVWPQVEQAVHAICGGDATALLRQITALEDALVATPLATLTGRPGRTALRIHEYTDDLAGEFRDINAEWISSMFVLEQTDNDVLNDPRGRIVDPGGTILFVEAEGLGIVGTCALQKTGPTAFELTKMGVRESARGLKAGEFLLAEMISRAAAQHAEPLYLLTHSSCEAAIHLYEKLGFQHDAEIMKQYGARYARCNVAMIYPAA